MKRTLLFWGGLLSLLPGSASLLTAQPLSRVAILSIDSRHVQENPEDLANLLRLELQKTNQYEIVDRYDMLDMLQGTSIEPDQCYSKRCLLEAAQYLEAEKILSGSVERYGDKILITLKLLNTATQMIEKTDVSEYLDAPREIQHMLKLSMSKMFDLPLDPVLVNNLSYYNRLSTSPTTRIINNGPRMGMAYMQGEVADRLMAPLEEGGYDMVPFMTQFGYQHEIQYLSSGNFQALVEMIGMLTGLEQSQFIPTFTLLNGFRESKTGLEIGFGPSFGLRRVAQGYFGEEGVWHLAREWQGPPEERPPLVERIDKRGEFAPFTRWVWSVGKTFRSGYLNIPINLFASYRKEDWTFGLSMGFNLRRARRL